MFISYNEACARDCSTLEQDLVLCEKAGFDYIEIRLDMLTDYLKRHTVEELAAFFCTSRLKPHAFNALYLYPEFLSEGDDEARQKELLEEFRLGCEVGRAIGSHYFIIVPPLQRDPAGGPYTSVGAWLEPSLGTMNYRRVFRYTFLNDCDYNDLCKAYRQYVREQGHLRTLKEKAVQNPSIHDLVGTCFVHTGIKTVVQPESGFFDPQNPEKNNRVVPFSVREQQIREIHDLGVEKVYLHLDGWAEPGYDNQHPDYTPACQAAGGWEDMKSLVDTMHDFGYKFGIHDQYRDYYHAAPSYDENYACRLPDGTIPGHSYWAGGPQSYLCATQAPFYVKRNFAELKKNGIRLDGAYLDVFTCNEGDECANPEHVMTRRDCYTYRGNCFSWLLSQGILSSSEEVSDWAVPYLVFCHYAPYDFMLRPAETPKKGIPVPLFNLVYHDCVIEPWMMDHVSKDEDYMLYALLAGGAPYLVRDGAYPNTDGAFDGEKISLEEMTERCRVVTELHEKTALLELVRHECMTADGSVQKSEFSDGTYVICDFAEQIYEIGYGA